MDSVSLIRFVAAFALVLSLIALMAWVLKRWPGLLGVAGTPGAKPRLKIIEQRGIDSRRRLVLVQRDDVQHLLLVSATGECVIETGIAAPPVAKEESCA